MTVGTVDISKDGIVVAKDSQGVIVPELSGKLADVCLRLFQASDDQTVFTREGRPFSRSRLDDVRRLASIPDSSERWRATAHTVLDDAIKIIEGLPEREQPFAYEYVTDALWKCLTGVRQIDALGSLFLRDTST